MSRKYAQVVDAFAEHRIAIDSILLFDAIIGNKDRHLNNLATLTKGNHTCVPLFDNGASMLSDCPTQSLKLALSTSFSYQRCKPFYDTVGQQLGLIHEYTLNPVSGRDVAEIVSMFLNKKRAAAV